MTERFYDIKHLTTRQLRELFSSCRKHGWVDFEYYELSESKPLVLADAYIDIKNLKYNDIRTMEDGSK
jgi:hypothetical protein